MKRFVVSIATVGCRSNQADSAEIVKHLDSGLIEAARGFDQADLAVINTCSVTAEAERDCRKLARRVLGASKKARVILWGCAVSADADFGKNLGDRVERYGGIDNPPSKMAERINAMARQAAASQARLISPPEATDSKKSLELSGQFGRTRALLKIQNGCSHFCAYCVVPFARGPEQSVPLDVVLSKVALLSEAGCNEVVLTGVQLGAWGAELPGAPRLAELVVKAADRLAPGRLRLSSLEPWSVDDALIEALAGHERICPHLHLPLQSGDDGVLAAMKRGYTAAEYIETVNRIRRKIPDVSIGTDVLLGFPGEDDVAYGNTLAVLREIEPAYLHAFTYSPRPGTEGSNLSPRPKRTIAKERTIAVREFGDKSSAAFRSGQTGRIREIIVEEFKNGAAVGLTDNFIPVRFSSDFPKPGDLVTAKLRSPAAGEFRLTADILK